MIRSFHNIKPVSGGLVALVGLLFALVASASFYFSNPQAATGTTYLYIALGTFSIVLQGLYFNRLCVRYDIVYTHTFIPALFYVIIGCSNYYFIHCNVNHIYAWLFLLGLSQIVAIPDSDYPRRNVYSAAILFGIISLLVPFYIAAVLALFLFILIFKTPNFLDILAIVSGFALPILLVASINLIAKTNFNYFLIREINFDIIPSLPVQSNILLYPAAIFIFGSLRAAVNYFKNNIQTRRMLRIIVYILLFHVLIILLNLGSFYKLLLLLIIPLSISFTYLHLGTKRVRLKSVSTILLVVVFLVHLAWQIIEL